MSKTDISDDNGVDVALTERMRQATRTHHDTSNRLINLKLSVVLTSKPLYAEAISLFWPIFLELETLLEEHKNHEQLKFIYPLLNVMRRAPRFEDDFASLLGSEILVHEVMQRRLWTSGDSKLYSPPELQSYIDRLRHLSKENPIVLVAYVYHMYSAIFAGGAIVKRMVKLAYGIKSDDGVQIFILPHDDEFPNSQVFQNKFKRIINHDLQITESDKQQIIQESMQVFQRNNTLVATVKDSDIFAVVFRRFTRSIGGILLVVIVIIAVVFGVYRRK